MNGSLLASIAKTPGAAGKLRRLTVYSSALAVWLGAALLGWSAMLQHTYQPAMTGSIPDRWPKSGNAATDGYRILVFAHPFCPCTQATLDQLDESLRRLPANTTVEVIFTTPGFDSDQIGRSRSLQFARSLSGVAVRCDDTGDEARRFRATISGEVFGFDPAGRRVFHGGITAGRGHRGASAGQDQLERLIQGGGQTSCTAPVFGCALPFSENPRSPIGMNHDNLRSDP